MQVLYLHGFASSPQSSKARFFAGRLAARDISVAVPDLNQPDFSTLTVSRMLEQVSELIARSAGPVSVVGSSLGGFVAVQAARQHPDRDAPRALAPALDFDGNRLLNWGIAASTRGSRRISRRLHYGYGRMTIHYDSTPMRCDTRVRTTSTSRFKSASCTTRPSGAHGGTLGIDPAWRRTHARRRPPVAEEPRDDLTEMENSAAARLKPRAAVSPLPANPLILPRDFRAFRFTTRSMMAAQRVRFNASGIPVRYRDDDRLSCRYSSIVSQSGDR